jgi:hypothetical protein
LILSEKRLEIINKLSGVARYKINSHKTIPADAGGSASNPSYSGSRSDQEDCGSKPAWANRPQDSTLKKNLHTKGLVEWLKV